MAVRVDLANKPLPVQLRLRAQRVTQKTLNRYLAEIELFRHWLKECKMSWSSKKLDSYATRYITFLQETEKREVHQATYFVYGLQLLHCDVPRQFFLPNAKLALSGWKHQQPGSMRLPVPEEVVFDIAIYFLSLAEIEMAMALVLQMHCYLRPSECLGLTKEHVCFPAPGRYRKWGLLIAPSTLGQQTKTGKSDDSVLIGDVKGTAWVADVFALFVKGVEHFLFPSLTLASYETACHRASRHLKYQEGAVTPHVMRHTGPSNDIFHKRRDIQAVQKRGRWEAKASARRYEKASLLVKRWEVVHESRRHDVLATSQHVQSHFRRALR